MTHLTEGALGSVADRNWFPEDLQGRTITRSGSAETVLEFIWSIWVSDGAPGRRGECHCDTLDRASGHSGPATAAQQQEPVISRRS